MKIGARFVIITSVVVPIFAACNSQQLEMIGSVGQALLAQGQPCTGANECATGFCVDGVCFNTACGGTMQQPCGIRDQFSCSNMYGQIGGLVDGICFTLQVNDACGELGNGCDPCTARGSKLTQGNNCPNPQL